MTSRKDYFKVLISPFLKGKLLELENTYGKDSWEYKSVAKQYEFDSLEDEVHEERNNKHYEASTGLTNIERLYKNHCCVELNFSCAAHCRYCLRSNYEGFVLSEEELDQVVEFVKDNNLNEILITGGDPFLSTKKLSTLLLKLSYCSSLKIVRIATRTFTQNPNLVTDELVNTLTKYNNSVFRIEVATQIGSPIELTWDETINAFKKILSTGIPVYSQNVFMKGVNDTPEHLIDLYFRMRMIGITPHYLFNCCPIKNIHHFRPSLKTMIHCYESLVNSGEVTGRSKPLLALMTSIGKITLTPFNVIEYKEGEYIKLSSKYKLVDRLHNNPNWHIPEDAWVNDEGYLCIKYLDGND